MSKRQCHPSPRPSGLWSLAGLRCLALWASGTLVASGHVPEAVGQVSKLNHPEPTGYSRPAGGRPLEDRTSSPLSSPSRRQQSGRVGETGSTLPGHAAAGSAVEPAHLSIEQLLDIQSLVGGQLPDLPSPPANEAAAVPPARQRAEVVPSWADFDHGPTSVPGGSGDSPRHHLKEPPAASTPWPSHSSVLEDLLQPRPIHQRNEALAGPGVQMAGDLETRQTPGTINPAAGGRPTGGSSDSRTSNHSNPLRSAGGSSQRSASLGHVSEDPLPEDRIQEARAGSARAELEQRDRPQVQHNRSSQSLSQSGDSVPDQDSLLELPPPYSSVDSPEVAVRSPGGADPSAGRSSGPIDRPLSQVITSPNLPLRSGFHTDELDWEEQQGEPLRDRMSDAEFAQLRQRMATSQETPGIRLAAAEMEEVERLEDASLEVPMSGFEPQVDSRGRSSEATRGPSLHGGTEPSLPGGRRRVEGGETGRSRQVFRLADFSTIRQHWHQQQMEAGPAGSVWQLLGEADYWNQRGDCEMAWRVCEELNAEQLTTTQRWELAWQQALAAVEMRHPGRIQQQRDALRALGRDLDEEHASLDRIYQDYLEGHWHKVRPDADYVQAVDAFYRSLQGVAQHLAAVDEDTRRRLAWVLVDAQCQLGHCIGLGPYGRGPASGDQWFRQAAKTVQRLVETDQADRLLRVHGVLQQAEAYAAAGRFAEIPVSLNYLDSLARQLRREGQKEDGQWIEQRLAQLLLECGLTAYNYGQWDLAANWAGQAASQMESKAGRRDAETWDRYNLARVHWLIGACQFQAGKTSAALAKFEESLAAAPRQKSPRIVADRVAQGERMAIMAVAFWEAGQRDRAVELNLASVQEIETAIEAGLAMEQRLDRPAENLNAMLLAMQADEDRTATAEIALVAGQQELAERPETGQPRRPNGQANSAGAAAIDRSAAENAANDPTAAERLRQQLEDPRIDARWDTDLETKPGGGPPPAPRLRNLRSRRLR